MLSMAKADNERKVERGQEYLPRSRYLEIQHSVDIDMEIAKQNSAPIKSRLGAGSSLRIVKRTQTKAVDTRPAVIV